MRTKKQLEEKYGRNALNVLLKFDNDAGTATNTPMFDGADTNYAFSSLYHASALIRPAIQLGGFNVITTYKLTEEGRKVLNEFKQASKS